MTTHFDFTGRNVLITGATRGIGQAIARVFAKSNPAQLVLCGSHEKSLELLNLEEFSQAQKVALDLASPEKIKDFAETMSSIDILINNAGIIKDALAMRMSPEDFKSVFDVNLHAAFTLSSALIRHMMKRRYGRIINIASVVAFTGNAGQANYSATKAALIAMSKTMALEAASRNITVNCIAPGFIETDMTHSIPEEAQKNILSKIPIKKMGTPEDIAYATAFLASEEASYITGTTLHVNGGLYTG